MSYETLKVHCASAQEFYRAMDHELTGKLQPDSSTLFRGISDSEYDLVPSSRRPEGKRWLKDCGHHVRGNLELGSLASFYRSANELGLGLPPVPSVIHSELVDDRNEMKIMSSNFWPNEEVLEVLALAQHHGLKTPLQDWTRSHLIAMRFAASGALKDLYETLDKGGDVSKTLNRKLAVWVLLQTHCSQSSEFAVSLPHQEYADENLTPFEVTFIYPPTRSNHNIVAQMGCFSFHSPAHKYAGQEMSDDHSLQYAVEQNGKICALKGQKLLDGVLTQFTVPVYECFELLRILDKHGVTAAKLFPGFDGVVAQMEERRMMSALLN